MTEDVNAASFVKISLHQKVSQILELSLSSENLFNDVIPLKLLQALNKLTHIEFASLNRNFSFILTG